MSFAHRVVSSGHFVASRVTRDRHFHRLAIEPMLNPAQWSTRHHTPKSFTRSEQLQPLPYPPQAREQHVDTPELLGRFRHDELCRFPNMNHLEIAVSPCCRYLPNEAV